MNHLSQRKTRQLTADHAGRLSAVEAVLDSVATHYTGWSQATVAMIGSQERRIALLEDALEQLLLERARGAFVLPPSTEATDAAPEPAPEPTA